MNTDQPIEIPTPDASHEHGRLRHVRALAGRIPLFAAGILAALLAVLFYRALLPAPLSLTQDEINTSIANAMASATPPTAFAAQVYQVILPSLVLIQTEDEHTAEDDRVGIGSGVVINMDGDILTALHVVEGATEIKIFFADGSEVSGTVSTSDPAIDIAVLHPDQPPELIVPAVLGSPGAMNVGDEAFAVGNPLGLAGSLSAGVISGFDRSFTVTETGKVLNGLIQFDAAVNPGNSGGPLLNRAGQVIGIVTALANPSESNSFSGIGFAVPITVAGGAAGAPEY